MKRHLFFYLLTLCFITLPMNAQIHTKQAETDSISANPVKISLLTCAAGEEIYSLFGHTAIRYEDSSRGIDIVFNYGMFSFNTPNFALRFALGETDYQLGVTDFQRFAAEYIFSERAVWQQTLNLSSAEKTRLWNALRENYLPQNRVYRYNFFSDNCATRPRDQIEACIDGKLQYNETKDNVNKSITWRDLLHQYTENSPWSRFGIDLCIGSSADCLISFRERMFIPFYTQNYFRKASILSSQGEIRPLISQESQIIQVTSTNENNNHWPTPFQTMLFLLIIVNLISVYGVTHNHSFWILDAILFSAMGIAGCIIAFLVFFSQHPAVNPNWIIIVLHPLHLICLPCILHSVKKKLLSRYLIANLIVLTLFIAFWAVIPQNIPLAVLPLALCLLIRSVSNLLLAQKNGKWSIKMK